MTTIGETETIAKLSARLEKKYSYLRRAWRHSKQNWCPHDVCQGCLKTLWHSGHKSFLSSRFRNFILAFDIDRIFWYLPYSLILRIAFCIGRYYDEEVHLQRDCKQSGNEENVVENNSMYFEGSLGMGRMVNNYSVREQCWVPNTKRNW